MNVQHVESVGPLVQQITGVQVRETVPDWVMQRVDEIVLADLTPQALQSACSAETSIPWSVPGGRCRTSFVRAT